MLHLYLVPIPRLSVSVRRRRGARAWSVSVSVSVGPAGLLASGLLLWPTLDSVISMRRTDSALTLAGVTSVLDFLSGSVSEEQIDAGLR